MADPIKRTEYRVVGENFRGEPFKTKAAFRHQVDAETHLAAWKRGGALNGRVQQRTVTESPWIDVEAGEADRG